MTAIEITRALKADRRNAVLWINEQRKEAAFHPGNGSYCVAVNYISAMVAKADPAFGIIDETDGRIYAAL